jgi:hypothetical protein
MDSPVAMFECLKREKEQEHFDRGCMDTIVLREQLHALGGLFYFLLRLN